VGEFKDGKKNGQGTMKFKDGAVYEGGFRNDKSHGKGVLQFAEGDKYVGDFENGNFNGIGTMYDKDGNIIYTGKWINGDPEGGMK
ncbi:MAG TPA: hypothetical protein PKK42_13900, partial [Leptospiraceae bacterium]|nr:hypothetical protein [Leptospiraceae bacterium]